jgi:hypothetical protein
VVKRTQAHVTTDGTSDIWGLVSSIARVEFPNQYELLTVQIIYIRDWDHCNMAETVVSALASSYSYMGGNNGKAAGATPGTVSDDTLVAERLEFNIDLLLKPSVPGQVGRPRQSVRGQQDGERAIMALADVVQ